MNVELVKIRTIFELTGGRDFKDPAKIESIVFSSILNYFSLENSKLEILHKKIINNLKW